MIMPLSTSGFTHYYNDGPKRKADVENTDVFGARPNILRNANANTAAKTGAKIKSNKAESVSSMGGVCDKHGAIVVSCIFCQTPY